MKFPKACIVVFAKEPVAGNVKTRLIPALGAERAKRLHVKLMSRLFKVINQLSLCDAQLWVNNNPLHPDFAEFKGEHYVQSSTDLGQRMFDAASQVLERYQKVIIIGSDCPKMNEAYLEQAILALNKQDVDIVLGPAADGGYVLIAMKAPHKVAFESIEWGTDKVMQQTRQHLQNNKLSWYELPELFDIDRPEDLVNYRGTY